MAIEKVAASAASAATAPPEKFGKVFQAAQRPVPREGTLHAPTMQPEARVLPMAQVGCAVRAKPAPAILGPQAGKLIDRVSAAQHRLDRVLALAQSGKSFSPAELLALQTNVYRASQELDLAGKVVEKATSGVKQVLQTQI